MQIKTERLVLRPWKKDDLAPFAEMNADPRVMEYFPSLLTREESDALAEKFIQTYERNGWGLRAASPIDGEEFIGYIGLNPTNFEAHFTPAIEVGWRLKYDFWNKGFATEGAKAVIEFGFSTLNLEEIVSFTALDNWRSRRVMGKLGMAHDPIDDFDHPKLPEGHRLRRHVLYRIKRKDYENSEEA